MSAMGPRFLLYRMPDLDTQAFIKTTATTLGHEIEMRDELTNCVTEFFAGLDLPADLTPRLPLQPGLVALADFTARARSPIERDTHYPRDIELVPRPEVGARLYRALAQLARGLEIIGLSSQETWWVIRKIALDGVPALRHKVLHALTDPPARVATTRVLADQIGYSTPATHRALEDLAALELVHRESDPAGGHRWQLHGWVRNQLVEC